jgi:YegS/Rv2252/BmrU family lipid kinase
LGETFEECSIVIARGNTMRIKFIVNPKSKKVDGTFLRRVLNGRFADSLVDIEQTVYPHHAFTIAQQAVKDGFDTIVAVGGDGTVNEVLNGIIGAKTTLGIIPTGTANDLASYYHIPKDIEKACGLIDGRHLQPADVIRVNGWCYVTAGGIGLPSEVAGIANAIKSNGKTGQLIGQLMGSKLYMLAVMGALLKTRRYRNPLSIKFESGQMRANALSLTVNNQPFLGRNFLMSPGAVNNDGMLDICLIESSETLIQTLLVILKVLTGRHIYASGVRTWRMKELIITTEKPMSFLGDGEICQKASDFKIEILPRAVNVITAKTNTEAHDHGVSLTDTKTIDVTQNHGENHVVLTERRIS